VPLARAGLIVAHSDPQSLAVDDPRAQERDLLRQFAALAPDNPRRASVREALVVLHQPLVRSLAQRYAGRGEPLDDLIQAGNIGLLKTIDRFDPERGDSLIGLLIPTVLGEIRKHFRDKTWAVRVPRSVSELGVRLRAVRSDLEQSLGRSPTVPELAQALGVDEDAVLDALEAAGAYRLDSLDAPGPDDGSGDGGPLQTIARAQASDRQDDDALLQVLDRHALRPALAELTDRERAVLRLRFVEQRTQGEIAEDLGVDQSQVSRLLARTLLQLRERLGDSVD
jgi:RNA polymerase sigma-B factor